MLGTLEAIVNTPLFLAAILMVAVFFALQSIKPPEIKSGSLKSPWIWLRQNYWKAMLILGLAMGLTAGVFYLYEIAISVASMVDRLRDTAKTAETQDLRNLATGIAVLLGALAAAATLIFQLVRVWISERTTSATEEGLITDRINKAVAGLGAEKTVRRQRTNREGTLLYEDGADDKPDYKKPIFDETTEPNLEVRIGAIYALERIAQDSLRDHIQIMEILCAYIRENSNATAPENFPLEAWEPLKDDANEAEREAHATAREERFGSHFHESKAFEWARSLPKPRNDIQVAIEVIGRRSDKQIAREQQVNMRGNPYRPDLRDANLQACDVSKLNLDGANLVEARLEGAILVEARLEGANLWAARLEGANLGGARLEGANLWGARLEGANLWAARLEGADLRGARLEGANLWGARLEGANLWGARLEGADLRAARLEGANLGGARLEGANLGEARLEGANLGGARLEGANLGGGAARGGEPLGGAARGGEPQGGAARCFNLPHPCYTSWCRGEGG